MELVRLLEQVANGLVHLPLGGQTIIIVILGIVLFGLLSLVWRD
jgi:hypothetical protein